MIRDPGLGGGRNGLIGSLRCHLIVNKGFGTDSVAPTGVNLLVYSRYKPAENDRSKEMVFVVITFFSRIGTQGKWRGKTFSLVSHFPEVR